MRRAKTGHERVRPLWERLFTEESRFSVRRCATMFLTLFVPGLVPSASCAERIESAFGLRLCGKDLPAVYERKIEDASISINSSSKTGFRYRKVKPPVPNKLFQEYDLFTDKEGRIIKIVGKIFIDPVDKQAVCRDVGEFLDQKYGPYRMYSEDGRVLETRQDRFEWKHNYRLSGETAARAGRHEVRSIRIDQCEGSSDYITVEYAVDSGCEDSDNITNINQTNSLFRLAIIPFSANAGRNFDTIVTSEMILGSVTDALNKTTIFSSILSVYSLKSHYDEEIISINNIAADLSQYSWIIEKAGDLPKPSVNYICELGIKLKVDLVLTMYVATSDVYSYRDGNMDTLCATLVDVRSHKSYLVQRRGPIYHASFGNFVSKALKDLFEEFRKDHPSR